MTATDVITVFTGKSSIMWSPAKVSLFPAKLVLGLSAFQKATAGRVTTPNTTMWSSRTPEKKDTSNNPIFLLFHFLPANYLDAEKNTHPLICCVSEERQDNPIHAQLLHQGSR